MPKIWLAIFFGYKGTPFNGMQFQLESHVRTVEGELVDRLYDGGFLATKHHTHLQKQERWSRAARTDKGVHAVVNGISCMFTITNNYYQQDNTLNREKLERDIRELFEGSDIVFHCMRRVTPRFQTRMLVKSRHYCYICPKYLFLQEKKLASTIKEENQSSLHQSQIVQQKFSQTDNIKQQKSEEANLLGLIRKCCELFIGTHNFHNYSKNLKAKDPQAKRYVIQFSVQTLNEQFFIFNIVGQSFIYNQIRKMIGCIIFVFINGYPPNYIENTFFRNQIHMPIAPARGLYLNAPSFEAYNLKKDIPQKITFDEIDTVQKLKKQINSYIVSEDETEWREWVKNLKQSIYHGVPLIEQPESAELKIQD